MRILFYDTETTGIPDFGAPSESEHQPHMTEAAAFVVDSDTRQIINAMNMIVRPDGWTIPDDVSALTGITTEHALDVGIPESLVTECLLELWRGCELRVAHSQQFDARIVRIAIKRHIEPADEIADKWKAGFAACTAQLARPIVKLPKSKIPTLGEAYQHFTGKPLENAHRALPDAQACAEVYWAIREMAPAVAA